MVQQLDGLDGHLTSAVQGALFKARQLINPRRSHIQIFHVQGVFFDEFAAGFDFVAHEDAE